MSSQPAQTSTFSNSDWQPPFGTIYFICYFYQRSLCVQTLVGCGPHRGRRSLCQSNRTFCRNTKKSVFPQPAALSWTSSFLFIERCRVLTNKSQKHQDSTTNLNLLAKDGFVRYGFLNIPTKWLIDLGQEPSASLTCSLSSLESWKQIKYTLFLS